MNSVRFPCLHVLYPAHLLAFTARRQSAFACAIERKNLASLFFGSVASHKLNRKGAIAVAVIAGVNMPYCVCYAYRLH